MFWGILLLFLSQAYAQDCSEYLNSCDYYLCLEERVSCGDKGYFVGFGYKYCDKFRDPKFKKLEPRSQKWLKDVSQCLRERVLPKENMNSCKEIKSLAIATHAQCYSETGFCELAYFDKLQIKKALLKAALLKEVRLEYKKINKICRESIF